ncbi:MAG: phenylalanine--tRNA ligase subunit beta, partial [Opitutales bacterium]
MKVSLQWLRSFLPGLTEAQIAELPEVFPRLGLEVEEVTTAGMEPNPQVVVGEVLNREQHPNADKLGVCVVDAGQGGEPLQIVCGASNYKVGDRVPVALVGAKLPGDFKIKKSKLRGVESFGMLCSAKELGLGEDHAGLLILEGRPELGKPVHELFPEPDTVYELELTANRGDCLSHLGVAREVAAWFKLEVREPEIKWTPGAPGEPLARVRLETPNCPYYTAWSIRGVTVAESPAWLKRALESVGLRPINNVVDITNFVLWETGQPLHAFDAQKIGGRQIVVRETVGAETITTLDEKSRCLPEATMVIADAQKPLVVAGVMGSVDAEVDFSTTEVLLESAYFQPGKVRQTTRALNLFSDSSHRFTRDVDPQGTLQYGQRAAELIADVAGGEIIGETQVHGEPP